MASDATACFGEGEVAAHSHIVFAYQLCVGQVAVVEVTSHYPVMTVISEIECSYSHRTFHILDFSFLLLLRVLLNELPTYPLTESRNPFIE